MNQQILDPQYRDSIKIGAQVRISNMNGETDGIVKTILTQVNYHVYGIKVKLQDETVGRVIEIYPEYSEDQIIKKLEAEFWNNLKLDESETLEFKATFLADYSFFENTGEIQKSEKGSHTIAKTIAAFANNKGGTLYIGIHDETRNILGLQYDYSLPGISNSDKFVLKLSKSLDSIIDKNFYLKCIDEIRVLHLKDGDICVIKVKPSKIPILDHMHN